MTKQFDMLDEAICFATEKHKGQKRRDGSPYIYHPLEVSQGIRLLGFNLDYQVVAVLHDTLEDTDTTEEELTNIFGENITKSVKLLTRTKGIPEENYVDNILTDRCASYVKIVDKINNLRDSAFLPVSDSFKKSYHKKAVKYYKGKFCPYLDVVIGETEYWLTHLPETRDEVGRNINKYLCELYSKSEN